MTFVKLAGTDDAAQPFWSPDSRYIGFVAGGRLKRVSVSGGAPKDLGEAQGFSGGTWSREGTILFGSDQGIFRVSADGGVPSAITTLGEQETGHFWPSFLPDGQHFLYLAWSAEAPNRAVYIGKLGSEEKATLMPAESNAAYAEPGYIVFHREGTVFARPFDTGKMELYGEDANIADEVAFNAANGRGNFDVSQTGTLLYFQQDEAAAGIMMMMGAGRGAGRGNFQQGTAQMMRMMGGRGAGRGAGRDNFTGSNVQWGWVDRAGTALEPAGEPGPYGDMDLSPDGRLIAVTRQEAESSSTDIWVIDWQRAGVASRWTFDLADDINPVWAPDGKHIAFTSYRKGNADIYVIEYGSGEGKEIPLLETEGDEIVEDWSPDGKYIAYLTGQDSSRDIYALPMENGKPVADKEPFPVVQGQFRKDEPQYSYDGKLLAYTSDRGEPGTFQVYVRTFPAGDLEIPVSVEGGGQPRWNKDGKELYYRAPDGSIMAVEIRAGARLEAGIPRQLFRSPTAAPVSWRNGYWNATRHMLEVTPDGVRFLLGINRGRFSTEEPDVTAVPRVQGALRLQLQEAAQEAQPASFNPSNSGITFDGLTVIQNWTSAIGKAEK